MARAFKNMQKRAARGRRSTVNDTYFARVHQLEVLAYELCAALSRSESEDEDLREACAEYQSYLQEVNRGK